jgi:hypothetical protein
MYYEKLNQGCIAGWRIRQNHLWRFENGGFQGRGMKQEEAIAAAQKENELVATANHKAAAALALAQGHPGVKIAMSTPGVVDTPPMKKQRTRPTAAPKRKASKKGDDLDEQYYPSTSTHGYDAGYSQMPGSSHSAQGLAQLDPMLDAHHHAQQQHHQHQHQHQDQSQQHHQNGNVVVDNAILAQAMQAAAAASTEDNTQMDELEMGMELPIEMQMHSAPHDEGDERYAHYGAQADQGGQAAAYGYTGSAGEVYGAQGYQGQ